MPPAGADVSRGPRDSGAVRDSKSSIVSRFVVDLPADDERPPMRGEVMFTARTCYLVTGSREVESRVWCNRWALELRRLGPARL